MGFDADFEAQLIEGRARVELMDRLCREVGRDPVTLRRSFNLFDATIGELRALAPVRMRSA